MWHYWGGGTAKRVVRKGLKGNFSAMNLYALYQTQYLRPVPTINERLP